jgi:hypothetical protein
VTRRARPDGEFPLNKRCEQEMSGRVARLIGSWLLHPRISHRKVFVLVGKAACRRTATGSNMSILAADETPKNIESLAK